MTPSATAHAIKMIAPAAGEEMVHPQAHQRVGRACRCEPANGGDEAE